MQPRKTNKRSTAIPISGEVPPQRRRRKGEGAVRFYYKGNRLKQLRAFCMSAKLGTFSRAAEALFLSQPSISLQIGALERELGVALIERGSRRVQLTREGRALYELALPLVDGFDAVDANFRTRLVAMDAGEVTIAAGISTIQYLMPNLVQAFRQHHPKVRLHLVNVTGNEGLAMLRNDSADFAVGSMVDVPNDLAYEAVYHFDPMLITPPNHPLMQKTDIGLEDLSSYGLILPPRRVTTYRLVDLIFQQARVPYQVAIEVGGWEIIKQYVSMGLGISIVTGICLRPEDRLEVRNMRAHFPQRSYGVVMRRGKYLSPQARAFLDLIKPDLFNRRDAVDGGHSER
ncbi:MAG: LysR family transcriptional regulator [Xanthomonadales bacterium]|nr:LysR family transcriptional regulator [Xanthomonadales bacterium]